MQRDSCTGNPPVLLTQAAVAEVLSQADVAQLAGSDPAHLQRHGRALAKRLHGHAHRLHLQHQHGHLEEKHEEEASAPPYAKHDD